MKIARAERKKTRKKSALKFDLSRVLLSLVSVLVFIDLARPVVSEFYASKFLSGNNGQAIFTALAFTGEEAKYSRALGCVYQNASGTSNLEEAAYRFRESLSENPLDARTWLSLARVYGETGKKDLREFAMRKALDRSSGDPRAIWDSGVLLFQMGNTPKAVVQLGKYIRIRPDEQRKVYELCITLGLDPEYIQDKLVPQRRAFFHQWLDFLIDSNLTEAAGSAWSKLCPMGPWSSDYLEYCGFLINKGHFTGALAVWNKFFLRFYPSEKSHKTGEIWNGGFDMPLLGRGFDWKIGKEKGVRIFLDENTVREGRYSLGASFDGTSNPDIYLARQIIPVEEGHAYTVSGYMKTSGITTTNGIFFEVQGYKCHGLEKSSQPVSGTNSWKQEAVEFRVPPQCRAVIFGVRRAASTRFDNKISGDIWVDSIHMADEDPE